MPQGDRPGRFTPPRESSPPPHRLSVPDPEDIGLPRAKRSYVLPLVIALALFVVIIALRLLWG
jgi:hypothetical protein